MNYRHCISRILLAAFLVTIPGAEFYRAAAANFETREVSAITLPTAAVLPANAALPVLNAAPSAIPQLSETQANVIDAAQAEIPQAELAQPMIQNLGTELAVPSLQNQDASAASLSGEAGAAFDAVKLAGGNGDGGNAGSPASKDEAFLGAVRNLREPGEMINPVDTLALGQKLGLSQDETWKTVGRLSALGQFAHFSSGHSLVVALPKADPDDQPAVEGRALAVKAVALLNSDKGVDHVLALALLQRAYMKFPKSEDEPAAAESRRQISYLRLNAALEVVRNALDAEEAKQAEAGPTQKSLIADAKKYFYTAYYDIRQTPMRPERHVTEVASDAVSHADLAPYRERQDFKLIELGLSVAKSVAAKPAPEAAIAPAVSPESEPTNAPTSTALMIVPSTKGTPKGYPAKAPIIALTGVWFPNTHQGVKLTVEGGAAFATLTKAVNNGGYMIASTFIEGTTKHNTAATLVRVYGIEKDGKKITAKFDILETVAVGKLEKDKEGTEYASISYPKVTEGDADKLKGLAAAAKSLVAQFGPRQKEIEPYMINRIVSENRPDVFANVFAQELPFSAKVKQAMLSAKTLEERLETGVMELMGMVRGKWGADKAGAGPAGEAPSKFPEDMEELTARMEQIGMPPAIRKVAVEEFSRLAEMGPKDSEGQKVRAYVGWLLDLPWSKRAPDSYEPANAKQIMDEGHTGLEEVKDRILEYLAVRKLTGSKKGAIILFVGPKGTGKTSITSKIAKALGRPMVRLSLGGIRDVTDLKGHNRTYLGSQPGAIAKLMKEAGVNNPVFLLDEIDKMDDNPVSGGAKASLLETLDPKQNDTFRDTYLEVPYDLSQVLWIVTANTLETIPEPLRDRMEIIEFSGYTPIEKLGIAKNHILAEKAVENGLAPGQVQVTDAALKMIIEGYTREAGVRKLYEQIDKLFRKISAWKLTRGEEIPAVVDVDNVRKYLGVERFHLDDTMSNGVGIMTGLAVTGDVGGTTLNIEVVATPGKGELKVTGNLKQVMSESTQAAFTFVKSRAKQLGIPASRFSEVDIHVHFPDGATPKDGPSAGLAIAAAIASRLTGRAIKPGFAMTGEISLTGQALPIGGLMQKSMGAHRAGMHTVIFPEANKKDLDKIPDEVKHDLKLISVKTADEVLDLLLEPAAPAQASWTWWKPWTWPLFNAKR